MALTSFFAACLLQDLINVILSCLFWSVLLIKIFERFSSDFDVGLSKVLRHASSP